MEQIKRNENKATTTTTITVIDAIMGAGKTSWALEHMEEAPEDMRFIYITPYLEQVERIKDGVTSRVFKAPSDEKAANKLQNLKELIVNGADIVSTHSLFSNADEELIELLTDAGYTLILDEVMNVVESADVSRQDIKTLQDAGNVKIDGNKVEWINDDYIEGRFQDIKLLARAGNLYMHRNKFLLWTFPSKIFDAFDDVYVLTYLFDAQLQRYYYDYNGIDYEYKSVKWNGESYELTKFDRKNDNRSELMELINLYEGPLNEIGSRKNALSSTWLNNADTKKKDRLQKNLYSFFRHHIGAKGNDIIWTTKKSEKDALKGKGYANSFIPLNLRATNDYANRWALAYMFNRYMTPNERVFFEDNGVKVNQDLLAVSDLLQWIWRSRIRNGEQIELYLPSSRMRKLLKAWANYEI